jgi:hypothetical protein
MPSFPERAIVREVGLRGIAGGLAGETPHGALIARALWRAGSPRALPQPGTATATGATA